MTRAKKVQPHVDAKAAKRASSSARPEDPVLGIADAAIDAESRDRFFADLTEGLKEELERLRNGEAETDEGPPFLHPARSEIVAWLHFFSGPSNRPFIGPAPPDFSEQADLVVRPLHQKFGREFPKQLAERSFLFHTFVRLATALSLIYRKDATAALSLVIPLLVATKHDLARAVGLLSVAYGSLSDRERRLKKPYRLSGSRPHLFLRMCMPTNLRTSDDVAAVCGEAFIDNYREECIFEAHHNYEYLTAESPTNRHELVDVPVEEDAREASRFSVVQVNEVRSRVGKILDEVERGRHCLVRAHRRALAVIRPATVHDEVREQITRSEFAKNPPRYLHRARDGGSVAIRPPSQSVGGVILERPPERLLREPTTEEKRERERDRKRRERSEKGTPEQHRRELRRKVAEALRQKLSDLDRMGATDLRKLLKFMT